MVYLGSAKQSTEMESMPYTNPSPISILFAHPVRMNSRVIVAWQGWRHDAAILAKQLSWRNGTFRNSAQEVQLAFDQ